MPLCMIVDQFTSDRFHWWLPIGRHRSIHLSPLFTEDLVHRFWKQLIVVLLDGIVRAEHWIAPLFLDKWFSWLSSFYLSMLSDHLILRFCLAEDVPIQRLIIGQPFYIDIIVVLLILRSLFVCILIIEKSKLACWSLSNKCETIIGPRLIFL